MQTTYVVTEGDCYEYVIAGVFSTREKAEAVAASARNIFEFTLDEFCGRFVKTPRRPDSYPAIQL